ncbi:MAG: sensor histidine kinase [Solirubrobacteraceae bacterium]
MSEIGLEWTEQPPAARVEALAAPSESRLPARMLGILRLLLLPIVLVTDRLVSHPLVGDLPFDLILIAATIYSLVLIALRWRGPRLSGGVEVVCDLTFVSALAFASGRAFGDLRPAFFVIPLGAAIALTPRRTALVATIATAAYFVVGFTHPSGGARDLDVILVEGLYVAWVGVAAVVLATLLGVRRRQVLRLARSTGALVAQAVDAEERAQRQVSDALHDHALQNLLTARQDLADARAGDADALGRAERALALAVDQVRSTVRDLHPYVVYHLDLASALTTIAEQQAMRGGYQVDVHVQPSAAGPHDALIASVARELLINATRHAAASKVTVTVTTENGELCLSVADDGRGCTPQQRAQALREGHVGLAASRERLLASSGRFEIESAPDAGTTITCVLPLEHAEAPISAAGGRRRSGSGGAPARGLRRAGLSTRDGV